MAMLKEEKELLSLIYTDTLQPSAQVFGKSLKAVVEFVSIPLMALQLQNDKVRLNFQKRLNEYEAKLNTIPNDKREEVHPQIGVPIVEKLLYTTSDQIADMFTSLLASASSSDTVNTAHPAFISMIERMSADESKIVKYLSTYVICYSDFLIRNKERGDYRLVLEHATILDEEVELDFPQNIGAYLSNLVSLGIITDENGRVLATVDDYNNIKIKYEGEILKSNPIPSDCFLEVRNSYFKTTPFGDLFISACMR